MEVKSWFISVWTLLDPLYYTCTRLKRIDSEREKNVFRVRLMKYRGKRVDFPDGSSLERGDLVVRIHLHNVYILQEMAGMNNELARAKWLYNTVRRSLPGVHDYLNNHPKKEQLKGIVGITLLNRGNRRSASGRCRCTTPFFVYSDGSHCFRSISCLRISRSVR